MPPRRSCRSPGILASLKCAAIDRESLAAAENSTLAEIKQSFCSAPEAFVIDSAADPEYLDRASRQPWRNFGR
jgi:hypothetical protein